MEVVFYIIGYLMVTMIAFYILNVIVGMIDGYLDDDDDEGFKIIFGLSFVWPALLCICIVILPFKVMRKAAEATVKTLNERKKRDENNEH